METRAGPHPLRLFVCLIPLYLALLLGPGRPGTAEEGEETGGCSSSLACQKIGGWRPGVLGGVVWRYWRLYWGLKQADSGKQRTGETEKRCLSNGEERGIEELGLETWEAGEERDQESWEPKAAVRGPVRRTG